MMFRIRAGLVGAAVTAIYVLSQPLGLSAQHADTEARRLLEAMVSYRAGTVSGVYAQEPKDSLYRAARRALNDGEYQRAAELFELYFKQNPQSSYAAQSLYYQAYALYKSKSEEELREARDRLRLLRSQYSDSEVALREAQALQAYVNASLARMGDAAAAQDVTRLAYELQATSRALCESEEAELKVAALSALMRMNPDQALPIVKRMLAERDEDDECTIEMRRKALFLLARHMDDESVDLLVDVVRNDPAKEVRTHAVHMLARVPGERTFGALEEILSGSDDLELQMAALTALRAHGGERADEILRELAMRKDAPVEVRAHALQMIARGSARDNARFLRDFYRQSSERELQERIILALSHRQDEETARWLFGVARDESEPLELRSKAIFMAARSGIPSAELASLYDQVSERELKEQIILSLSRFQDDDVALNKLLDVARNEEDFELRKKAIFWLQNVDDPRVAELLMEIIEGGGQ